jgi:hypothetical protein
VAAKVLFAIATVFTFLRLLARTPALGGGGLGGDDYIAAFLWVAYLVVTILLLTPSELSMIQPMLASMLTLFTLTDFTAAYGKDIWMSEPEDINNFFHVCGARPLSTRSVTDRR